MRGIHRWPMDSPHRGPVTRKAFPDHDVKMIPDPYGLYNQHCVRKGLWTTRTQKNSYPIQLLLMTTRTQDNSYPVVLGTSRLGYELSWVRVVQVPSVNIPVQIVRKRSVDFLVTHDILRVFSQVFRLFYVLLFLFVYVNGGVLSQQVQQIDG